MPKIDQENTPPPEGEDISSPSGRAPHIGQRLPHAFEGEVLRALHSIRGPQSLRIKPQHESADTPFHVLVETREGRKYLLVCLAEEKNNPFGDQHGGYAVRVIRQGEWDKVRFPDEKIREVGRHLGMVFPDWS